MPNTYETKLWGGRFRGDEDALMQHFNSECWRTSWLVEPDIQGSLAHVAMQVKCGLLTSAEGEALPGPETIPADFCRAACLHRRIRGCAYLCGAAPDTPRRGRGQKAAHRPQPQRPVQCGYEAVRQAAGTSCGRSYRHLLRHAAACCRGKPVDDAGLHSSAARAGGNAFKYHLLAYCEMMLVDKNAC